MEDNFYTQLVREPTRECTPSDLLFMNRKGLVGGVMVRSCLEQFDHRIVDISILSEVRRGVSKTVTLDFGRVDFII